MVLDELINLHKSIVEMNANANAALSRATKEANDAFSQLQSNFALAKQIFQDQLIHDIEVSSTKTQSFFEMLVKGMDTTVQSVLSKLGLEMKAIESDAANLSEVGHSGRGICTLEVPANLADLWQNVHKANVDSAKLEKNIAKIFQQVVSGSAELAATQTEQWDLSLVLATELQNSLKNMKAEEVGPLLGGLTSLQSQLVSPRLSHNRVTSDTIQQTSNELMSLMYLRQNELYEVRFLH